MRTIYLAKRSSVEEEAATVGQNHFHVLLDRWKPLALDSLEEVSHLRSQKSICSCRSETLNTAGTPISLAVTARLRAKHHLQPQICMLESTCDVTRITSCTSFSDLVCVVKCYSARCCHRDALKDSSLSSLNILLHDTVIAVIKSKFLWMQTLYSPQNVSIKFRRNSQVRR